jgi:hypothetical protein
MGRGMICAAFWWRNLRESDHLKDPGVDGKIILRRIFKKWDGAWPGLIWLRIERGSGGL